MFDLSERAARHRIFRSSEKQDDGLITVCRRPPDENLNGNEAKLRMLEPLWTGLAVPPLAETALFQAVLKNICPSMSEFIDWMAGELALRRAFLRKTPTLPPILLHGPPGAGKTFLARAIAATLHVPSTLLNAAASTEARLLLGTAQGYSSATASLPARFMAQTRCAAPLIIVDELDKAANSALGDALLAFLEPVSARGVLDEFLMSEVDTSHITWIATANDIRRLPEPLLSRFSCFEVRGGIGRQDPTALFEFAGRSLAEELGLGAAAATKLLDPALHAALTLPPGASIRTAKALLRAALGAQVLAATRH